MTTNFRFVLSVFLGFTCVAAFAQRDQGGFIAPGDSLQKVMPHVKVIYLPQGGFTLFDLPEGEFKGKILSGPPLNTPGNSLEMDSLLTSTIMGASIRPQLLSLDTYFETFDNQYYLSFDKREGDYIRVLNNSYQGWIAVEEILNKGCVLISWMEFYGESKGNAIHPREKIADIRSAPYPDAPVIETADELYSEIITQGKCEGSFCKVNVVQYKNPYDPDKSKEENVLKKYKGWIQIIDDEGNPLVAHNSHGA